MKAGISRVIRAIAGLGIVVGFLLDRFEQIG
jgi:hypothetical protein